MVVAQVNAGVRHEGGKHVVGRCCGVVLGEHGGGTPGGEGVPRGATRARGRPHVHLHLKVSGGRTPPAYQPLRGPVDRRGREPSHRDRAQLLPEIPVAANAPSDQRYQQPEEPSIAESGRGRGEGVNSRHAAQPVNRPVDRRVKTLYEADTEPPPPQFPVPPLPPLAALPLPPSRLPLPP